MLVYLCASCIALACVTRLVCKHLLEWPYQRSAAPYVRGWPLLGKTISLALHGADFVHRCRKQYGDIFRVSLGGQHMTYLLSPEAMKLFFSSPDDQIAFRPATEHFTNRVFGLPSEQFFPHHAALLSGLRGQLTPAQLPQRGHGLLLALQHHAELVMSDSGKVDLMACIKSILFPAALESLFGSTFLRHHGRQQLQKAFFAFEEGFELAASPVPHWLQPSFCRGRRALLEAFRISWAEQHFQGTVVGQLLDSVPELHSIAPNVLLALLWASLANTVPATFWALSFLLPPQHAHYKHQIMRSLQSGCAEQSGQPFPAQLQDRRDSGSDRLVRMACDRNSLLAGCVSEAMRLRAPGVAVRMAACDLPIPLGDGFVKVRKGDMLAVSPYESHLDDRFFHPNPEVYNPTRGGLHCPGSSLHEVPGVGGIAGLVFGGGRYRCPGRFFAEMEVSLAAAFLLTQYDLQLASCQPPGSQHQLIASASGSHFRMTGQSSGDPHGLLPMPETRCQVGIRWPQSVCEVCYQKHSL